MTRDETKVSKDLPDVSELVSAMADDLAPLCAQSNDPPLMIGIRSGGVWIAEALHDALGLASPLGVLDISFYRDDFGKRGLHPEVRPSHLPESPDERVVILVDDVLYSGRTVRAALNEIFDYGRPARVVLAVLAQRPQRALPICADVVGIDLADTPHADSDIRLARTDDGTLTLSARAPDTAPPPERSMSGS